VAAAKPSPTEPPAFEGQATTKEPAKARRTMRNKNLPGLAPIPGPPLPISMAKQQKLSDLLRQYQADEITPEQYHSERAKILAEP
jgi:hypothetical protein